MELIFLGVGFISGAVFMYTYYRRFKKIARLTMKEIEHLDKISSEEVSRIKDAIEKVKK